MPSALAHSAKGLPTNCGLIKPFQKGQDRTLLSKPLEWFILF